MKHLLLDFGAYIVVLAGGVCGEARKVALWIACLAVALVALFLILGAYLAYQVSDAAFWVAERLHSGFDRVSDFALRIRAKV
ncbi:MAG: hypothetical protein RLZZ127_1524 [Planctomycetota bacterium]|jgi:hypothetical protein